jgi:hypothetical protein
VHARHDLKIKSLSEKARQDVLAKSQKVSEAGSRAASNQRTGKSVILFSERTTTVRASQ